MYVLCARARARLCLRVCVSVFVCDCAWVRAPVCIHTLTFNITVTLNLISASIFSKNSKIPSITRNILCKPWCKRLMKIDGYTDLFLYYTVNKIWTNMIQTTSKSWHTVTTKLSKAVNQYNPQNTTKVFELRTLTHSKEQLLYKMSIPVYHRAWAKIIRRKFN